MARKPGNSPQAIRNRAQRTAAAMAAPAGQPAAAEPKKRATSPAQFIKEVRAEGRKITWTTRKETWITSVMVAIMVVLAAAFFGIVDFLLRIGMNFILQLANG